MTDPRELAAEALKADAGPLGHRFDYAPLARELLSALDALDAARRERAELDARILATRDAVAAQMDSTFAAEDAALEAWKARAEDAEAKRDGAVGIAAELIHMLDGAGMKALARKYRAALAAVSAEGKP